MVAISDFLSMSLMVASYTWPSCIWTLSSWRPDTGVVLETTWALVMIRPVSSMTKPEPLDRGTVRPNRGCLRKEKRGMGWKVGEGGWVDRG